jgi:N-acetylneuraminic acid mutarotase
MLQKFGRNRATQQLQLSLPACNFMKKLTPVLLTAIFSASTVAATLPSLPEPVSNQLVLQSTIRGKGYLVSFAGIGADKTASASHNKAWQFTTGNAMWQPVPAVPNQARKTGRLAATGLVMSNNFFIFSGYSVDTDGSETTLTDSYRFSPVTQNYTKLPDMPVPADDSLALSYQNRYIYLVSGWHNDGNINLVQVFDNFSQKWSQATPYPGTPVFGLGGAAVGNQLLVCDGVKLAYTTEKRSYAMENSCYLGTIDSKSALKINWQPIAHHGQPARYRQAAVAITLNDEPMVAFIGGSENPYNFNGIGYNGAPSEPSAAVYVFALKQKKWLKAQPTTAVMDLRSLVSIDGDIYSVGGMVAGQNVTPELIKHQIKLLPE